MNKSTTRTIGRRFVPRAEYFVLLLILLLALVLRLWGAYFDLPYIYHPDEPLNINIIQGMLWTGDLNPHYFDYPSLMYDINAAVAWLYFGIPALIAGKTWLLTPVISNGVGSTLATNSAAVALFRSVTIFSGVVSTYLVYRIGKRAQDKTTGLIAATLFAISPLLVAECQHVAPDSYVVVFELLTIFFSLSIAASGAWISYIGAGIAVGLSAASKYNGALVCVFVITAHLLHVGLAFKDWNRLVFAGLVSALVFLAACPFVLLDYQTFLIDSTKDFRHYAGGHAGMEGNVPGWYLQELWLGAGIAAALACAQMVIAARERLAASIVLAVFTIVYVLFICQFPVRNDRTLLPIIPCVLLLATMCGMRLAAWPVLRQHVSPSMRNALLVALAIGSSAMPLMRTIRQGVQLTTIDSRTTAREWINTQLPLHSIVAVESYAPFVDPGRFRIVQQERAIDKPIQWYLDQGVDYIVLSQGMFGRYFGNQQLYPVETAYYVQLMNSLKLVKRFTDGGYEVLVYGTSPDSR
jgi:4-amino-4-deoxy-L-arabinose transferase-like glycosyltransferase